MKVYCPFVIGSCLRDTCIYWENDECQLYKVIKLLLEAYTRKRRYPKKESF